MKNNEEKRRKRRKQEEAQEKVNEEKERSRISIANMNKRDQKSMKMREQKFYIFLTIFDLIDDQRTLLSKLHDIHPISSMTKRIHVQQSPTNRLFPLHLPWKEDLCLCRG